MMDVRKTIVPKSDQLNADDLIGGTTKTIKVTKLSLLVEADQPLSISYEGDNGKPYKPCKSMRRVMVNAWGPDCSLYAGRSMTLYCDPKVKFGGMEIGGIRISHMSHIAEPITMALTASKAMRKPFTVKPLVAQVMPEIDAEIKAAGDAAAVLGVAEYSAWLGKIPPAVKTTLKPYHPEWSRIAKAHDEASLAQVDTGETSTGKDE